MENVDEFLSESDGSDEMDDDLEDYLDCLSGPLRDEAKAIVYALNNDRNQAQKARLEARMATTQINQKIHDIAEARWRMLPIAVQREHDILAMDISELQWHVKEKQEKQELVKAEEKLDYASTINKRLKADIDFNKNHSPLVEEKLRLEQAAMTEIKKEQEHQDNVLLLSRAQLKVEEEKFERRTSKINANKKKYEDKLDKVTKTLNEIKSELELKNNDAARMEDKITATKQRIEEQEATIADLKEEAIELQKKEREGIANIEQLKIDIKTVDADTATAQAERETLRIEKEQRHKEYEARLQQLQNEHDTLVNKLQSETKARDELRLENEDSKRRQGIARANIAKLEKENTRLASERDSAEKEHNQLIRKIRKLEKENMDYQAACTKRERQCKTMEDNLQMAIDQTRNEIEEEIKAKNIYEQRLRDDTTLLEQKTEVYNTTTREMEAHIKELGSQLEAAKIELGRLDAEKIEVTAEYEKVAKKLEDRTQLNAERMTELNEKLESLTQENKQKKGENDELTKQLEKMMKHQAELEGRTRDLITQQKILGDKTVKVEAEIEELTEQLRLVKDEHQVQVNANEVQKERLEETKKLYERRKGHFDQLIAERKQQLEDAKESLKREIELNAELAKRYKVLQAQQLAVKSALTGFYESRVFMEEAKVWMNRVITMENKYFEKTKDYFDKRDILYQSQFASLDDEATKHINMVVEIEKKLENGNADLGLFLDEVSEDQGAIQHRRQVSMVQPVSQLPKI